MTSPGSESLHGKLVLEAKVEHLHQAIDREQSARLYLVEHVHSLEARIIALEDNHDNAA